MSAERTSLATLVDPRLLGRHQIAALVATFVDFATMIALVELTSLSPPPATMISASIGGIVNFVASRFWAFHARHDGTLRSQAIRYGVVSLVGALVNANALALVLHSIDVPYPLARIAVSIAVSVLYTYPLHTRFVFRVIDIRNPHARNPDGTRGI